MRINREGELVEIRSCEAYQTHFQAEEETEQNRSG